MEPDASFPYNQRESEGDSWNNVYDNMGNMCRTCATQNDFLIPIFDGEGLQHRLDLKIPVYLPIQIMKEDILPLHLCYTCASTIISWHSLFLNCQEADHKFRTMLGMKEHIEFSHRPALILAPQLTDTDSLHLSPQNNLEMNFSSISQNSSQPGLGDDVSPHILQLDPHQTTKGADQLSSAFLSSKSLDHYAFSNSEAIHQNVLEGMVNSSLPEAVPSELTNSPVMSNIAQTCAPNYPIPSDQPVLLSNVSTQTDNFSAEQIYDQSAFSPMKKMATVAKKLGKPSLVLKKKKIFAQSSSVESSTAAPQSSLLNCEETFNASNRVSTIQSTSSNAAFPQDNSCSRSKSVLVRNESFRPLLNTSEYGATSQFASNVTISPLMRTEVETIVESAVIREHRNVGNSTVVSVVRPTCLRRAPTKGEVLDKVIKDDSSGREQSNAQDANHLTPNGKSISESLQKDEDYEVFIPTDSLSPSSFVEDYKNVDLLHTCFHCKKFISNSVLLLSHEKSHLSDLNPPSTFLCKVCSSPQKSLSDMHGHYASHGNEMEKLKKKNTNRKAYICKQCGQMCTTEERLAAHQRSHSDAADSFTCKTCGETFSTRSKLSVHLWSHALKPSNKTFKCHICGKGFSSKSAVMEHRLKHTEEEKSRAFKCVICGMAFGNNTLLGKHRSTHTEEELARPFKCSFCNKAFARNHTLQIHHLTHSDEKSHVCSLCGKGFKMRNSLIQHMRTHQDPSIWPTFSCHLCEKVFRIKSRLRDHLRLHNGDKPYECKTCRKRFHKVAALHTHEISHTDRRPYMCDVCGKAFKWSKNLRQHKSVHNTAEKSSPGSQAVTKIKLKSKDQPCQCEICGKQLSGKSSLRQHIINIHNEGIEKQTKPTSCPTCGKVLSSVGGMMRHMKITHGGLKAFKCDMCEREYSTKVARDDHRRSHTGERPYGCNVCTKTFTSLSNLHIHRLIHSEDRPHKCSYCDKQFKRRAHLIPHIRIHTGEKPYVCNVCNRGFTQSNDLHKHQLTHTSEKAHSCHCGMAYRIKRDLKRHQLKHHPSVMTSASSAEDLVQEASSFNSTKSYSKHVIIGPHKNSESLYPIFNPPIKQYESTSSPSVLVRNSDVAEQKSSVCLL